MTQQEPRGERRWFLAIGVLLLVCGAFCAETSSCTEPTATDRIHEGENR